MKGIVDRIEGKKVVVEMGKDFKVYDMALFKGKVKEGDLVEYRDGEFFIREEETLSRKRDIENLFNSLIDKK